MTVTTPVHFSTGTRARGLKRAKQYPGNSGQSTFFLRSFQRLHRVTVGRKASMCLRSSCSRTTCSWRERVHTANHRSSTLGLRCVASSDTRVRSALVGGVRLGEPLVV